jgi:uncharacterized repeat protein (TIGR01451 family)
MLSGPEPALGVHQGVLAAASTNAAPDQGFPSADMSISITPPAGAVRAGAQNVRYIVTIINHGPDGAPASVDWTMTLPAGVTLVSERFVEGNSPSRNVMDLTSNGRPAFNIATMRANSQNTFEVIVNIGRNVTGGRISAEVTAQGATDPNQSNNTASVEVLRNR